VGSDIVISYRGTDNILADMQTGWTTGADHLSSQAKLAAGFYYAVKAAHPTATNVLTGHSLGGGLAGFVAKQRGKGGTCLHALSDWVISAGNAALALRSAFAGSFIDVRFSACSGGRP
jgi:hypothetical protein